MSQLRSRVIGAVSAAACLFTILPAHADGYSPGYAAPLLRVSPWTGFYGGANGGAIVDGDAHWDFDGLGLQNLPQFGDDVDGEVWGGHVGYNYQFANFVLGIEGDGSWGSIDGSEPCENTATFTCTTDIDQLYSVRGRAGYAFDHLLVYGTAGWAWAEVSIDAVPNAGGVSFFGDSSLDGFVYGGGAEYKLHSNISVGVEALHYDFDESIAWSASAPAGPPLGYQDFDTDFTVVRGRLSFHFDHADRVAAPLK
jgi:outer membrane immunogenic protein